MKSLTTAFKHTLKGGRMVEQRVDLAISPHEFFREKIKDSSKVNAVSFNKETEFYLVNLLCQFIEPTAHFSTHEEIDFFNTPLALILKTALESSPDRQILLYKLLGDTSLYLCGLFQESLEKKKITSSYVISLGSQAYEKVSILMKSNKSDSDFTRIYSCLSEGFEDIVKVLVTVSHKTFKTNKLGSLLKKMDDINSLSSKDLILEFEKQGISSLKKGFIKQ